jgi:hypothetical protein
MIVQLLWVHYADGTLCLYCDTDGQRSLIYSFEDMSELQSFLDGTNDFVNMVLKKTSIPDAFKKAFEDEN